MSWQRLLELSRQRGIPLIVTDLAGREPMVIMPLAEYERTGEPVFVQPQKNKPRVVEEFVEEGTSDALFDQAVLEAIANESKDAFQKQVDMVQSVTDPKTPVEEEGLSTEERFYLEPVDGERD